MAAKTPLKATFDGSSNVTGLAEFQSADFVAVADGGTGVATITDGGVVVGAGTAAVTSNKAAPSGDFVGTSDSQTLTNKTLTTPTLTTPVANAGIQLKNGSTSAGFLEFFEDSDNGTNKVTLIGPASTADVTLTLPSATDTLVGKATTDTLTNKTLTTPTITTPVVNAGMDLKNGATSAGFLKFFEDSDNGTNAVTLIGPASTADVTLTLPAATDTLVGKATTDTLTNKTLTTPAMTSPTVSTNIDLLARAEIRFKDADSSHYVGFKAPATVSSNLIWTLPDADGSGGQVLKTDGSGALGWVAAGGGSGASFPNSTVQSVPGSSGNYDLKKNAAQNTAETPFEAGGTDAFGVNLGTVFSLMDPIGSVNTHGSDGLDLGDGETHVGA